MSDFDGVVGRTYDESRPGTGNPPAQGNSYRPNILVWIMDDVGYGQLSPYGGFIETPALARLSEIGTRFSNAHVTPICAPTRACLLTGRQHNTNNMSSVPRFAADFPGHNAKIPRENGFISEILLQEGYATFAVGKWHLTTVEEMNISASRQSWPLGRGFEQFYGFLSGQTNQYEPHLVSDNHVVLPPGAAEEGYHLSADLVDQAVKYVRDLRSGDPNKPFFMNLAFGAGHAPHHAPRPWIDKYQGAFDGGWDDYRHRVLDRQIGLGIFPAGTQLSRRDPDVPRWDELRTGERRVAARLMEAYAGMISHMDHQVGRLMTALDEMGELDQTIIVALSDNGASAEGGPTGAFNNQQWQGGIPQRMPSLDELDEIGGPRSFNHYPWGWAWAGNAPFRRWKRETYRGGCAVPFVVYWPGRTPGGELRSQFIYATDLVPTLLEGLRIDPPAELGGHVQTPIEGESFLSVLESSAAAATHTTQYFEMFGHRSMYHDGWRAVCPWPGPSFAEAGRGFPAELTSLDLERIERSGWELYHVDADPSELHDVAAQHPDRLQELIAMWWKDADRYKVLPLIGRLPKGTGAGTTADNGRTRYVYYPDIAPVWIETAVNVVNVSHRITAEVELGSVGAEGMLLGVGDRFGGYALFMKNGQLIYAYNDLGRHVTLLESSEPISPGRRTLTYEFEVTAAADVAKGRGATGIGRLGVDGVTVVEATVNNTSPVMLNFSGTLTCGYHHTQPVVDLYEGPFRFSDVIRYVSVDLLGVASRDLAAEAEVEMSRQ